MIEAETCAREKNATSEAFETVAIARELTRTNTSQRQARQDTPPGESTLRTYAKNERQYAEFLPGNDEEQWPVKAFLSQFSSSKNSFYVKRASLKHRAFKQIEELLAEQDQLQRKSKGSDEWLYAILKLRSVLQHLDQIEAATHPVCLEYSGFAQRKSKSKRHDLKLLKDEWRDILLKKTASSKKYDLPAIVLRYTGCRPFELNTGVAVCLFNDKVRFDIYGAKCRTTAGQPLRSFSFEAKDLPDSLVHKLRHQGKLVIRAEEDPMRTFLAEVSGKLTDQLWISKDAFEEGHNISAYTLRHAFASDLRELGWTEEEVAAALGESVGETARHYGTARRQLS